jgi:hypothetical protein
MDQKMTAEPVAAIAGSGIAGTMSNVRLCRMAVGEVAVLRLVSCCSAQSGLVFLAHPKYGCRWKNRHSLLQAQKRETDN